MNHLGPEGKKLLEKLNINTRATTSARTATITHLTVPDQEAEVDNLINILKAATTTSNTKPQSLARQLLSNVAYYLPILKSETQICRLVVALLNSQVYFNQTEQKVNSFEESYLIIEVISAAVRKKILISTPTIPLTVFYNRIVAAILAFTHSNSPLDCLKQNLVIAGLALSQNLLNEYTTPEQALFFQNYNKLVKLIAVKNFNILANWNLHSDNSLVIENFGEEVYKVKALNLVSLACIFPELDDTHKKLLDNPKICLFGLHLISTSEYGFNNFKGLTFSQNEGNNDNIIRSLKEKPVIKLYSKLSFVIERAILETGKLQTEELFNVLEASLNDLLQFAVETHNTCIFNDQILKTQSLQQHLIKFKEDYWSILKHIVFSNIIILQGIVTLALDSNSLNDNLPLISLSWFNKNASIHSQRAHFHSFSIKILKILFFYHFILEEIGTGGFLAYKTVYSTATEILLQTTYENKNASLSSGEILSDFFLQNTTFKDLVNESIDRSKFLFVLGFWETLVLFCSPSYYDEVIVPVSTEFISKPYRTINFDRVATTRNILESAHSVKLSSFQLERLAKYNAKHILSYVDMVVFQFPLVLSAHQLVLATAAVLKYIHKDGVIGNYDHDLQKRFTQKLFRKIKQESPGRKIIDLQLRSAGSPSLQTINDSTGIPPTIKSALILAFIKTIPYLEAEILVFWLQKLYQEISRGCNSEEQQFCQMHLWNTISGELGLSKADRAIQWWYSRDEELSARL